MIAVAMDARGAEAAGPWIRNANATYPCLIDTEHRVSELYNMVNVPTAVWIDEGGRIVRPPETAGVGDEFRSMAKGRMSADDLTAMRDRRNAYLDVIRDWAAKGDDSAYALAAPRAAERLKRHSPDDALAAANYRLGRHLWSRGRAPEAEAFLDEAKRLRPDSWNYRRQTWNLQAPGDELSGGPPFWAAVEALGDRWYYEPVTLP